MNAQQLQAMMAQQQGMDTSVGATEQFTSLADVVDTSHISVLNADGKTSASSIFSVSGGKLSSDPDVDHQLILVVPFREKVKIRGLKFYGEAKAAEGASSSGSGPRAVRVWVDQPNITFEDAAKTPATDVLNLAAKDLAAGTEQKLKFVKYQSVGSITIFFEKNQGDTEVTSLSKLEVIGCTLAACDVNKIKKSG